MNFLGKALLYALLIFVSVSCAKEQGCTDPDSKNYDVLAEENDGSCSYEGNCILWYNESASQGLVADAATTLTFYVDGKIVGSTATAVYWTGAPNCGDNASITITKDLGSVKTQSYAYRVVDQTGFEYWSGTLNFNANTCIATQLAW